MVRLSFVRRALLPLTLIAASCSPFGGSDANVIAPDASAIVESGDGGAGPDADASSSSTAVSPIHCADHPTAVMCDDFEGVAAPSYGATTVSTDAAITFSIVDDPRGAGKAFQTVLDNPGGTPNGNLSFTLSPGLLLGDGKKLRVSFAYQVIGHTTATYELLGAFAVFYGANQSKGSQVFAIGTSQDSVIARDSATSTSSAIDDGGRFHHAQIDLLCTSTGAKTAISWTATVDGTSIDTRAQTFADAVSGVRVWIGQFYMGNDATHTTVLFDDVLVEVPP